MTTYVLRNGELVEKHLAAPKNAAPGIIRDTIDATWHPADGRHYDSKSEFRRVTKDHGCEEVGNELQSDRRVINQISKADVARAYEMVRQGYHPNVQSERLD